MSTKYTVHLCTCVLEYGVQLLYSTKRQSFNKTKLLKLTKYRKSIKYKYLYYRVSNMITSIEYTNTKYSSALIQSIEYKDVSIESLYLITRIQSTSVTTLYTCALSTKYKYFDQNVLQHRTINTTANTEKILYYKALKYFSTN